MRKHLLITTLLTIAYDFVTFGRLITTPMNQYAFVGWLNYTKNNCSSTLGSGSITWSIIPLGESVSITIASGSNVNPPFDQMYWIDQPTANDSNLIIRRTNDSTVGTFTCADSEMVAHAQLIMMHSLIASTNASGTLIIGDVITYSCQAVYLGNPFLPPTIYLYRYFEYLYNITSEIENSNFTITATAIFYQTASCLSYSYTNCNLMFGQPVGDLLPGSATNAPNSYIVTTFPAVKVSCEPSITGAISGAALYLGATLTCQLASTLSVNYTWTELTNGISSIGPQWTLLHGGSYQCNASFEISGLWQSVSTTVYNLTVETESVLSYTAKPLYGPIAGGTVITLTLENWSKEVANISAVYLGDMLKMTDLQSDSVGNNVVMTTPNATAALNGQLLPITIEFTPGPYNISTNLSFTYKGNPEITGISPSTFVVTGGTIVNVTGTQLSSVAIPLIQVTVVVERGMERNTTTEKSFEPCKVNAGDDSQMTCLMPSVNIPDDFLQVLDSQYNNRSKRDTNSINHLTDGNPFLLSRRKRYANALSLTGPNGVDQAVIYLGFILDGYQKYDNINEVLPDTQILIYSAPEINFTKDIIEFYPHKDESISVKGKHMTRGCRLADYEVKVGADVCENIDLTDNQLRCRPPNQQPQSTNKTSIICDQLLSIYINLGFRTYQYACMKYSDRPPSPTALIIGLAVGLSALVIVIILMIAIFCYCKRSRNRRPPNNTLDKNTDAVDEDYVLPSDQSYAYDTQINSDLQQPAKSYAKEEYEPPSAWLYVDDAYLQPSAQIYANEAYLQP